MPIQLDDYYLKFLQKQLADYVGSAAPPPNRFGNYQEAVSPNVYPGANPTATPTGMPYGEPPSGAGGGFDARATGLEFPGSDLPVPPPPGGNDVPSTVATGEGPPSGPPQPPYYNPNAGTEAVSPNLPSGGWPQEETPPSGLPPNNSQPPKNAPQYAGGDRTPAGVTLSPADRIRIFFQNLGLPPPPTGYDPFGGLPEGFTESNRFGQGAPTFTGPGFTGPAWSGGSIFGQLPGVRGGPLAGATFNLGASGGNLGDTWANAIGQQIMKHALQFGMTHSGIGYPAPDLVNAFMAMPGAVRGGWTPETIAFWQNRPLNMNAGSTGSGHVAGGGEQSRGTGGHQVTA